MQHVRDLVEQLLPVTASNTGLLETVSCTADPLEPDDGFSQLARQLQQSFRSRTSSCLCMQEPQIDQDAADATLSLFAVIQKACKCSFVADRLDESRYWAELVVVSQHPADCTLALGNRSVAQRF